MNSTQISCFLQVADTHSFTRAAAALYMTQQSLSRQIALLEEELGVKLLDRTTAFIQLTPAGQQYYATLSTARRQLDILKDALSGQEQRRLRRLRVGISQWLNPFGTLKTAMDSFRQAFPDTALELVQLENEHLYRGLLQGKLDLGFFSEGQYSPSRELRSQVVARGQLRLYGPRDVITDSSPEAVDRCWGLPMLMVPAWRWSYLEQRLLGDQEQEEFGLHPCQMLTLPNLHSMEAALRFGRCVTVGEQYFGIFNGIPGLDSLPLPLKEHLLLGWPATQPHPLQGDFLRLVSQGLSQAAAHHTTD